MFEYAFNSEFKERMQRYTRFDAQSFKDAMICNMDSIGKYMLEIILHQQWTLQLLKQKKLMQTQEDHSNLIPALNVDSLKVDLVVIQNTFSEKEDSNSKTAFEKSVKESSSDSKTKDVHAIKYKIQTTDKYFVDYNGIEVKHFKDTLLQHMGKVKKSVAERTRHQRQYDRRVNKKQMQTQKSKIDTGKALNDDLVVTESSGTESEVQDDNSSLMFNELLNGTTPVVSKSSAVNAVDAPNKHQQQNTTPSTSTTVAAETPPLNIQTTPETTCQTPTQAPPVTATENINQAETNKENAQVEENKFINIFCTLVQERGETSSRHVDSSDMHTFYQRHPSEHRWSKDHPLEQVIGNPS
uniref:Uncharacterized protein n=1 Tax=Tanacetum cinerariifolium TaxID=118510 RepID=A0A699GR60_TANCI|nr:hypothetical protein [Tanacetum cinerariifolium]